MKDKKPFVVELILGLVLAGASFFVQSEYYSTLVFAMGFGLSTASATQLIRMAYWQNPKRQEAYQAKQREEHILAVDERMQFLRMKAGQITYQLMAVGLFLLAFVLALFHADAWLIAAVFLLCLFQFGLGQIVYRFLKNRM